LQNAATITIDLSKKTDTPVKELSLHKATAMTSPQAGNSDVAAALATPTIDDNNLRSAELTAPEPHAVEAISEMEQEQPTETIPQNDSIEGVAIEEGSAEEEQKTETPGAPQDAPASDGAGQNTVHPFGASSYPQDMMAGLANMGLSGEVGRDLDVLASLADPQNPYYNPFLATGYPQVSMDGIAMMTADANLFMEAQEQYLNPSLNIHDPPETRISAYARLEFEDGHFYMNTYSVILGRDLAAHRAALRRDDDEKRRQLVEADPKTPVRSKGDGVSHKSVVSESGGILGEVDDSDLEERARRRKLKKASRISKASKKSKSTGSSSQHQSRRNSLAQPTNGDVEYQPQPQVRRTAPETVGVAPVDPEALRPSPYECPLIGIHPPSDAPAANYKNISRKHVKIKFNQKKHMWEAHFMGRNGGFIDDEFHPCQSVIPLTSGATMQIGGVIVRFVLPDVAIGETGAEERGESDNAGVERYNQGGKEMSYEFEDPHGNGNLEDTSEEESDVGREEEEDGEGEEGSDGQENDDDGDIEGDGDEEEDDRVRHGDQSPEGDEQVEEPRQTLEQPQLSPKSEKRRGPGRPPKDGIMSKREQKLAKKQAELAAQALSQPKASKKAVPAPPTTPGAPAPVKNKVGRPRKHPRPDTPPLPREKRKYTKRKPKEPKDGEAKPEGSGEDQAKEKKDKRPPRAPRSPTPTYNEAELTEEQLAKPNANYVTLIHEALSSSATGQMSLPQIYRAIQRKYAYFVCKTGTNGWQSSVRHNLSQHHAFRKVERDGKGWMWAIVEGVSIEKEKKRRATPPPQAQAGHQQIYPHMVQGHPYGPGMMGPPPGYLPMAPHQMHPGQPAAYMGQPAHMNGYMPPQGFPPPLNGNPPPGYPPAIPAQLTAPNNPQSYSSPYAPKPPPSNEPQPNEQPLPIAEKPHPPPQQSTGQVQQSIPTPQPQLPQQAPQLQQPQPQAHQQVIQATKPPEASQPVQAPQPQPPPQPSAASPPGPPQHNDVVMRAVETFKLTLIPSMKDKGTANAEEVVNSAVNRVLGFATQSTVPGDPHEDVLMSTLASMLRTIAGSNFSAMPSQQKDSRSPPPQTQSNHSGTQAAPSQPPAKTTGEKPTVMRPSFTGQGQNRPNGTSVPRPPMMTPGMKRTNSSGVANASSRPAAPSASHAPAPAPGQGSPNGASTPNQSPKEPVQLAGQKRPLDDADDMRDFKKLSTSGPPQLKT
jgi:Forkhead domain